MEPKEKTRENYYRRMAARQGLFLAKSKAKKWSIDDYQGYRIVDLQTNAVVTGEKFDLSLDDVARFLEESEKELKKRV